MIIEVTYECTLNFFHKRLTYLLFQDCNSLEKVNIKSNLACK